MVDSGILDLAFTIDTSAPEMVPGKAVPAVTVGMRTNDGRLLEARPEHAIADRNLLDEGVTMKFNAAKAGTANLHVAEIDIARHFLDENDVLGMRKAFGEKFPVTLAVTPAHAFLPDRGIAMRVPADSGASSLLGRFGRRVRETQQALQARKQVP